MAIATLRLMLEVRADDGSLAQYGSPEPVRWTTAAAIGNGDRRVYSISATTFQALTVPTGAKAMLLIPEAGAVSLTLKGITGDTGNVIRPSSSPIDGPTFTMLGASPSVGVYNGGSAAVSVEVVFL